MSRCIYSVLWFLVMICIGYPVGLLAAPFYVLLSPLEACCDGCAPLTLFLLEATQFPLICARNMVAGNAFC